MTKIEKAIKYARAQLTRLSPYVWGGQGEKLSKLTVLKLCAMEDTADNAARVIKFIYKNKGKATKLSKIYDCSGFVICCLIYAGLLKKGYDDTANGLMNHFKIAISPAARKPGDLVFKVKNGHAYHVGIMIDADTVAEAKGRDYGVVATPWSIDDWQEVRRPV